MPDMNRPETNLEVPKAHAQTRQRSFLDKIFSKNEHYDEEAAGGPKVHPKCGDFIQLDGFGGEFELTNGETTTLQSLVDISVGGVVLFTYPKANTPGCAAQACLFRDSYQELRNLGFAVYGLSRDPPKANLSFQTKNSLPFALICNPDGGLIDALGFRRPPNGIHRGVIVIDKDGKVLASMAGDPNATVRAVFGVVESLETMDSATEAEKIKHATETAARMGGGKLDISSKQKIAQTVATVAGHVNIAAQRMDEREGR